MQLSRRDGGRWSIRDKEYFATLDADYILEDTVFEAGKRAGTRLTVIAVVVGVAIETVLRPNLLTGRYPQPATNMLLETHGICISNTVESVPGTYRYDSLAQLWPATGVSGGAREEHADILNSSQIVQYVDSATAIRAGLALQGYFIVGSEDSQHLIEALGQLSSGWMMRMMVVSIADQLPSGANQAPTPPRSDPIAQTSTCVCSSSPLSRPHSGR